MLTVAVVGRLAQLAVQLAVWTGSLKHWGIVDRDYPCKHICNITAIFLNSIDDSL